MLDTVTTNPTGQAVKKEKNTLSFSISRILGTDTATEDDKPKRTEIWRNNTEEPPRVPHPSLHLYQVDRENNYQPFHFHLNSANLPITPPDNRTIHDVRAPLVSPTYNRTIQHVRAPLLSPTDNRTIQDTRFPLVSPTDNRPIQNVRAPLLSPTDNRTIQDIRFPLVSPTDFRTIQDVRAPLLSPTDNRTIHDVRFPLVSPTDNRTIQDVRFPQVSPTDNRLYNVFTLPQRSPDWVDNSSRPLFHREDLDRKNGGVGMTRPHKEAHTINNLVNMNDKSIDILKEEYQHSPSQMKCKKKKTRTVFSRSQVYQLESAFDMKRYLSSVERTSLASQLQLSETQIKIWFQNRRNKWKRQISGEMDEIPLPPFAQAQLGLFSQNFCKPDSFNFSPLSEPRDDILRGGMMYPPMYSHPYSQESRSRGALFA